MIGAPTHRAMGSTMALVALTGAVMSISGAASAAPVDRWTTHGPYGAQVNVIAIDPSSTVYLGTSRGWVFRSSDRGRSWNVRGQVGSPFDSSPLNSLVVDPTSPSTLLAANDQGVFRSSDSGRTWSLSSVGLGFMQVVVIDPTDSQTIYAGGIVGMGV